MAMALFLARWPDGSAWIVSAAAMSEVADILDEAGDPGMCEVQAYDGPFAIELRVPEKPQEGTLLTVSLTGSETSAQMQEVVVEAAFPRVHEALQAADRDEDGVLANEEDWTKAVAREVDRELAPSAEWAEGVREWWESMTGTPADRSAAIRDMHGVSIPGEPKVEAPEPSTPGRPRKKT